MPSNPPPKQPVKAPAPPQTKVEAATANPLSFGLMSLVAGSVAMSLFAVPYSFVRVFAILVALGGIGLAVMQFRTNEKKGRNFNGALTGALFSGAVILLTALAPYLPTPGVRKQRPVAARTNVPAKVETVPQLQASPPAQPQAAATEPVSQKSAAPVAEIVAPPVQNVAPVQDAGPSTGEPVPEAPPVPPVPEYVPKVVQFPCRKKFELVPAPSTEWIDAGTKAAIQGEVAVCVVSAAIEQPELSRKGKLSPTDKEQLVVRLQVMLVGSSKKVDFIGWSSANFGDDRNKPLLKDSSNQVQRLSRFDLDAKVVGHERARSLYPKLYADDDLFFEKPEEIAEVLRLELPASAFGGVDRLRFQIPRAMITGVVDAPSATK